MDKPANLGLIASIILLLLSIFIAVFSPLFHDMVPADSAVQAAENFESIVLVSGGFVSTCLGLIGSLLQSRGKKLSRILLGGSAILCFGYALFILKNKDVFFFCVVLIPAVLLAAAFILSFKPGKALAGNNGFC